MEIMHRTRITYTIERRTDGFLASVYLDNCRIAKKQLPTEQEARDWVNCKQREVGREIGEM